MGTYEGVDGKFGRVTAFEGNLRERTSRDIEYDGDVFSAYFKMAWDSGKFSYGALVPYDNFNIESFDANRIGMMLFGNYSLPLNEQLSLGLTLGRLNRPICLDHFLDLPNSVQNPVAIGNIRGFSGSKNQATNSAQKWRF